MATELYNLSYFNDANLQAYYRLEDVTDSKNDYDLTNNNSVAFEAAKFNNGANFGTANTNKSLSQASVFSTTVNGNKTISAWFKPNTELSGADTYYCIVALAYGDNDVSYEMKYLRESGVTGLRFSRERYGVGNDIITATGQLGTTNWHHIVLVLDGTTLYGYLDGSEVNHVTINTGNGGDGYPTGFRIGADTRPGNYGSVFVDDTAVFNRALSAAEILEIYEGSTNYTASTTQATVLTDLLAPTTSYNINLVENQ